MSSPSTPKRKRVDLTWAQKKTICEVHKNNPSLTHAEIAKYMVDHHGIQLVSRAAVTTILLQSSKWLEVDPQVCEGKIKRQRPAKWPQIEKALLLWVAQIRARRGIINDASLVKKADEFRNAFDVSESDLKLSHGWLAKFKKRHWIALHGESGDGDTRGVAKGGDFKTVSLAQKVEYIWMDGQEGQKGIRFNEMRSKTKVIQKPIKAGSLDFPKWSFDGSSTGQAEGKFSDCILNPVFSCPDPIRGEEHVLVLCEVLNPDSTPHETNTRRKMEDILSPDVLAEETLFGFEQEYTMFNKACKVYGWPEGGFPHPQGPFYCGVGLEAVYGRPLVEAHMDACIKAGLKISGINAEVMPGQWEFQIGPAGPLEVGDHVMVARWLLHRLGEDFGITCTFEPKPMDGDWNGAGAHTNYSTKSMREEGGIKAIHAAIEKLSKKHVEHISQYGLGNERRLTGLHETANINTFKSGVADRGASIRIPLGVSLEGKGYLEDRRPAANVDPYIVARMLIQTTLKN